MRNTKEIDFLIRVERFMRQVLRMKAPDTWYFLEQNTEKYIAMYQAYCEAGRKAGKQIKKDDSSSNFLPRL